MKSEHNDISPHNQAMHPWYDTAVATVIVSGAFSVVIFALIAANHFQRSVADAKREEQLENLKTTLRSQPDNQQLISQIRQLDLQIRQYRIRRRDFSRKGAYLLLASVVTFLVATKCAATFRKKLPAPQLQPDRRDEQFREAKYARWAVATGLVMLGFAALLLAFMPAIDFSAGGAAVASYPSDEEINKNWPSFRGPGGLGVSAYTNIPASWNGKTGEGILWKTELPLPGHNSPVVWGDRVFISGADPNNREVYCFDALSGTLLWTGAVGSVAPAGAEPLEVMEDTGYAAPTAVTDGRRVCAIFATGDIGCFDFKGNRVWIRSLGIPDSAYGYASSLAVYRNLVVVQYDQASAEEGKSKVIALDFFSGRTVWQTNRPVGGSWSSPIVAEIESKPQIITCGDPWVIAYDPANGAERWRVKCLSGDIAPSPIYAGGLILVIEPDYKLVAIRPEGRGDITDTAIAWSVEDIVPSICSPVSDGELIYLLTSDGLLCCHRLSDGTKLWEKELERNFLASPSIVGDRLYLLSEKGVMLILQVGVEYKELTRCELGEPCFASPAFGNGRIYIRATEHLYCIGK
jgi:outer membrane protein assembly factor BamB